MAVATDSGLRKETSRIVTSDYNLIVEDALMDDQFVHRQIIFENERDGLSALVQSEARLRLRLAQKDTLASIFTKFCDKLTLERHFLSEEELEAAKKKALKNKLKKQKKKGSEPTDPLEPIESQLEAVGIDSASSPAPLFSIPTSASPSFSDIDFSFLPCEYQWGFLLFYFLFSARRAQFTEPGTAPNRLSLIGVGGGSLSMFMYFTIEAISKNLPLPSAFSEFPATSESSVAFDAVELSQSVIDSSWTYFGFQSHFSDSTLIARKPGLNCLVTDGLDYLDQILNGTAESLPSTIIFDINNSGSELQEGLSFPPKPFLELTLVRRIASSRPKGSQSSPLLLINLGCRSSTMRDQILTDLTSVFSHVFCVKPHSNYSNIILACYAVDDCQPSSTSVDLKKFDFDEFDADVAAPSDSSSICRISKSDRELLLQRLDSISNQSSEGGFAWDSQMKSELTELIEKIIRIN